MVQQIIVHDREVRQLLKDLPKNVRRSVLDGINNWGKTTERNMKMSLARGGRGVWSTDLLESIEWRQSRNLSSLSMLSYGFALDTMRTHYVSLRKHPKMRRWAIDKGFDPKETGSIRVRRHPFIDRVLNKRIPKLGRMIQTRLDRHIK